MTSPATISIERLRARPNLGTALAALSGVALVAAALGSSGYIVTVLGFAAIYGIFCIGLNFFMGYTGQASFGQNAFAAVGGYGTAILCAEYGVGPVPALLASMTAAGLIAAAVGYPTLRLRGHYLAMATFALGLITYEVTIEWTSLTQGYMGLSGIPPLGLAGYELSSEKAQLAAIVAVLLLGVWISNRLRRSRFGRALQAIAGSEPAANALGINVARYKLAAFVIAALYASVAGSLFAHFVGFISPEVFGAAMVIQSFTMLYLGGIGTTWGPVIGAVLVSLLPEGLRAFADLFGRNAGAIKDMQDIAFTAILILMLIFAPKGLAGLGLRVWRGAAARGG